MWPRFRLTPEEAAYSSKYFSPDKKQMGVLRRFYYGELNTNETIRIDTETFQIARRSRLFGLTASGDVELMEVQITDITGEQYTTDYIPLMNLLCGFNGDPRSMENFLDGDNLLTGSVLAGAMYYLPLIFEPNIVLSPNQTVSVQGRPIDPEMVAPIHVSLCFHVWEFPGMPGSPV